MVHLNSDEVLSIARLHAEQTYRGLSLYRVPIEMEHDGWHFEYTLRDQNVGGQGPHYVIKPCMATILSQRYEQ
jgi:hypothetical protein